MKIESTHKALVRILQASLKTGSLAHKFLSVLTALTLCFGFMNPKVFAADNVLSQDFVAPPAEITLAAAEAHVVPAPVANVLPQDAFLNAGPLSPVQALVTTGRAFYVSTSGSDSATGLQGAAWKSISVAVSRLQAGDTLFIEAGTYQQSGAGAVFANSGTADAPITIQGLGNVIIQGVNTTTISGYQVASNFNPAFNTNGKDYINFKNLTVNNLRSAVTVAPNSSYIEIDGLKTDRNHFGVLINGGDHVTVRNAVITNSRNGVRTEAAGGVIPTDILFENLDVSGSKDVYAGFETVYRNGDGFILEAGDRITVRNSISHNNWDTGFDVKASNVLLENVTIHDTKNGIKNWGKSTVVKNALIYNINILVGDPVSGEGNGINARTGSIKIYNSTFVNNEARALQVDNQGGASTVVLENSIIHGAASNRQLFANLGGNFTDSNNIWYWEGHTAPGFTLNSSSVFADPKFVNVAAKDFHLQSTSPAINDGLVGTASALDRDMLTRVMGSAIDLGAFEYRSVQTSDTVPPIVNVVTTTNVAETSATVNWTTNEASDSQVEYRAQGSATWLSSNLNAAMLTNHVIVLSGLTDNTMYEFRVISTDVAGNKSAQSAVESFRTLTAADVVAPVINAATSSNVTVSGATISWTTSEASDSQVEYRIQGATTWLSNSVDASMLSNHSMVLTGLTASSVYEVRVKSKDAAGNLSTQEALTNFTTLAIVVVPAPTPTPIPTPAPVPSTCATAICGSTNGGTVSGIVMIQPNLTLNPGIRKIAYYLDGTSSGKIYAAPFTWGGTAGFDTRKLSEGVHTLSGAYTTATGDKSFSISFTVRNAVIIADTTTPVISAVASSNVTVTAATISWSTNEASDSQIEYRFQGSTDWLSTSVNTAMLTNHSMALSGLNAGSVYEFRVKSKDQFGNLATQPAVASFMTGVPVVTCTTAMCGIASGQTVSGVVKFQPNASLLTDLKKVAYYLNGTSSGKVYTAPFTWGGTAGFDTRTLADGTYTLSGAYTTNAGDQAFSVSFTVKNTAAPAPLAVCTTAMCGLSSGQTVSGIIAIQPNAANFSTIKKVVYAVNGTLVTRVYESPFRLDLDTRNYPNGANVLNGYYTNSAGVDVPFTINFTVKN